MVGSALRAEAFAGYPPEARRIALSHLSLLRQLPSLFAAILLRELIGYDWKFPPERVALDRQLALLGALSPKELAGRMTRFAAVGLSLELQHVAFAENPASFMERLTAWLWSSGQMEAFRTAAEEYARYLEVAAPTSKPDQRRLGIVILGQGAPLDVGGPDSYKVFRKLRPHGLYLSHVAPEDGLEVLLAAASKRSLATKAEARETGYRHWYIDGGSTSRFEGMTQISYDALQGPRDRLLRLIQHDIESGSMGPEGLRSRMVQLRPEDVGLDGSNGVLDRFALSLLTEGSGTQIFATTFVQWAGRECLRRAQPETLVLRYAPRREARPMNEMLSDTGKQTPDLRGSLIDADMGAYYTWLNMNRLPGADEMSFLVWLEGQGEAVAIGPGLPEGTSSEDRLSMKQVVKLVT